MERQRKSILGSKGRRTKGNKLFRGIDAHYIEIESTLKYNDKEFTIKSQASAYWSWNPKTCKPTNMVTREYVLYRALVHDQNIFGPNIIQDFDRMSFQY